MSLLPTTSEPLSLALFSLSAVGFLLALWLALRAHRAAPPRPNPKKEPFFALPPLPPPPEPKEEPKKSLTFDEEWLVPTVYRPSQSRPPREPPPAAFTEPPPRRHQQRRPRRPGDCPFDVPTVRYPSSLSVARMYARSILQETGAR